jgi:hypothetical protein
MFNTLTPFEAFKRRRHYIGETGGRLGAYRPARLALDMARADIENQKPGAVSATVCDGRGRPCYKLSNGLGDPLTGVGAPFDLNRAQGYRLVTRPARWIENPESLGLRFVCYADEHGRGVNHQGWFLHDDGISGEVARGVVYALPAKRGRARFVYGVADPYNEGPAMIAVETVTAAQGDPVEARRRFSISESFSISAQESQDWENESARADAATWADSLAEEYAERERDYNRAWDAGRDWADLGEIIAETRRRVLEILGERRKVAQVDAPNLCQAIRAHVESLLQDRAEAMRKRADLENGADGYAWDSAQVAAFNEGAGETVLKTA